MSAPLHNAAPSTVLRRQVNILIAADITKTGWQVVHFVPDESFVVDVASPEVATILVNSLRQRLHRRIGIRIERDRAARKRLAKAKLLRQLDRTIRAEAKSASAPAGRIRDAFRTQGTD